MRPYIRRFPRERYEEALVEALVACGYEVTLSSDLADEQFGEDARDHEFDIPIDFYIGNGNYCNFRYAEKLERAIQHGIGVLRVPATLIDKLFLPSCRNKALKELAEIYDQFISDCQNSRLKFRSKKETELLEQEWYWRHRPNC